MNPVELAARLIACPSVTPQNAGVMELLEEVLKPLGFTVLRQHFGEGEERVENLYARIGTGKPNLCFAGHTDVVPPGELAAWTTPPFEPQIRNGMLYGRGAEDMKSAIAAFIAAAAQFLESGKPFGSISLLITNDEEGNATYGTKPMLAWLKARGEVIGACIVGEPTNPDTLGEMIKIGRRGSVTYTLTVNGKQGHVAYPERADNPVTRLLAILHQLKTTPLDHGTPEFPASNLEVTSIDVGNPVTNVIPRQARAQFNIRFNPLQDSAGLTEKMHEVCRTHAPDYHLAMRLTGESFLTEPCSLSQTLVRAVREVTGREPVLSTTGGTSDARFIKDYCPVIEFGTTGSRAHVIDECVEVAVIEQLRDVYARMLHYYFVG